MLELAKCYRKFFTITSSLILIMPGFAFMLMTDVDYITYSPSWAVVISSIGYVLPYLGVFYAVIVLVQLAKRNPVDYGLCYIRACWWAYYVSLFFALACGVVANL